MTQYDSAEPPRRRIGLKAPLTGLVLVGLVVYGSYWGWHKAFNDDVTIAISNGCPTPTATTPSASATPSASVTPVAGGAWSATEVFAVSLVAATTPAPGVTATPTGPTYLAAADVEVNVLNATTRAGLAANTAAVLRDRGFEVGTVDNAPADDLVPEVAQLRAARADSPQVLLLIQHVPGAVVVPDGRLDPSIDLVLGDQFTSLGDPALVTPVPVTAAIC